MARITPQLFTGRDVGVTNLSPKLTALLNKGLDLHKAGDLDGAMSAYDSVLKKKPQNVDALWLKGAALISKGEPTGAVPFLQRAAKRRPSDAAILNDLGMAQEAAGEIGPARSAFERALEMDSSLPSAMINVARYAIVDGDLDRALQMTASALKTHPHSLEGHNTRGLAFKALGQYEEALKSFAAALSIRPDDSGTLFNKGETLRLAGNIDGAMLALERARQAAGIGASDWIKATMTLGLIAAKVGDRDAAEAFYSAVLEWQPAHIETLANRGELRQSRGNFDGASEDFEAALSSHPGHSGALYNRSRLNLLRGEWATGWADYEARWLFDDFDYKSRDRGLQPWDGRAVPNIRVLLWGEQGLGDQIQFASQLPELLARGLEPILEVDPRLVNLFSQNFSCPVFAYDSVPADVLMTMGAQCALGSLGRHCRLSEEAFEPRTPFLKPDAALTVEIRARYEQLANGKPIIGLAWTSMNPTYGDEKSLPLERWTQLLHASDAFYVSLQYGDIASEVASSPVDVYVDDAVDPMADICAATAQIGAVDHIISISNTAVHIAGAQGKPVWVIVPSVPEWRWGIDRKMSPWYPDVTIYRQPSEGNWDGVLVKVREDLVKKFGQP